MKGYREKIVSFKPKDLHEANERNQLLCVFNAYTDTEIAESFDKEDLQLMRERIDFLLAGEIHPARVDVV